MIKSTPIDKPIDKINDIISKTAAYNARIADKTADGAEIQFSREYGDSLWLQIDEEFTIFFGDWHAHYSDDEEEYQLFLDDLLGILENRKFTACAYREGRWCGSMLSEAEVPNESDLRNEFFGEDKVIECNYWDAGKNIIFRPHMEQDKVRVIKISKQALYEFIYEKFIESQDIYLDVDATEVSNHFEIDFENGEFIFCAVKSEDKDGNFISMPPEIDLKKIMKKIPDTANSMFSSGRYKDYTKEELIEMSKP